MKVELYKLAKVVSQTSKFDDIHKCILIITIKYKQKPIKSNIPMLFN